MIHLFIISIRFASLKKFLSNPPSMILRAQKMNIMIIVTMLYVLMVGCMGSDPKETDLSPEYKRKLFDVFNKTSILGGDHAKWMKEQWNEENPSQKESNHRKLYKHALSVIEEKCKDCERRTAVYRKQSREILTNIHKAVAEGRPEDRLLMHEKLRTDCPPFRNISEDLTWSLVHDWHRYCTNYSELTGGDDLSEWRGEMKANLLYIGDQIRKDRKRTETEMMKRWRSLYPRNQIGFRTLKIYFDALKHEGFQPSEEDERKAKERRDGVLSSWKGKDKIRDPMKIRKWTPQMKTDLLYIATHLYPRARLFKQNIKKQWDQMGVLYNSLSDEALWKRLYRMRKDGIPELKAKYVKEAAEKYEKLLPLDEESFKYVPARQPENMIVFLNEYREKLKKFLDNIDPHGISSHDTGSSPSSPQHSHSEHSFEEETSPIREYHQPESPQNFSVPSHPLPLFPEYGNTSGYRMQHYPNVSGHDAGYPASSSRTSHTSHFQEGGPSVSHQYHRPEFTQNQSAPIHSSRLPTEFEYPPGHSMHHYPDISERDTELRLSTPHSFRTSHFQEAGGSSASHAHHQLGLTQNLSASIHSSRLTTGLPSGYGTHHHPDVSEQDTELRLSTPRSSRTRRFREGGSSTFHDYHQQGALSNLSVPIPPSSFSTEFRYPPGYGTQTFPSDPVFDPHSHSPRPRRGQGSSTPKARRRPPKE